MYLFATEPPILIKNKIEQVKPTVQTIDCTSLASIPSTWVEPNEWMLSQTEEAANILEGEKPLNFTTYISSSGPACIYRPILVDRLASKPKSLRKGFYRIVNTWKTDLRFFLS
jgi:hypothetical protein